LVIGYCLLLLAKQFLKARIPVPASLIIAIIPAGELIEQAPREEFLPAHDLLAMPDGVLLPGYNFRRGTKTFEDSQIVL
jgi:hypothetical protein